MTAQAKESCICDQHDKLNDNFDEVKELLHRIDIRMEAGSGNFKLMEVRHSTLDQRVSKIESNINKIVISLIIAAIISAAGGIWAMSLSINVLKSNGGSGNVNQSQHKGNP